MLSSYYSKLIEIPFRQNFLPTYLHIFHAELQIENNIINLKQKELRIKTILIKSIGNKIINLNCLLNVLDLFVKQRIKMQPEIKKFQIKFCETLDD